MKAQTNLPLVLLVSDAPSALELAATALQSAGFRVLRASGGAAGVASARDAMPDLVLLDVTVPCVDCYEVTRRLRGDEATAGIPIVHISTSPAVVQTPQARKDSFDSGADAYFALPCEAANVVDVIRPLVRLRLAELAAPKRAEAGRLAVSRRVLLVDDHADSCELFQEVLRLEGHAVTVANNGELAVALLLADVFDVAVVDIGLPDIDGCDVARLTRERLGGASPLFVAMTGYGGMREREAATRAGFDLYLVKPIDAEALVKIVATSPANGSLDRA